MVEHSMPESEMRQIQDGINLLLWKMDQLRRYGGYTLVGHAQSDASVQYTGLSGADDRR